MQKSIISGVLLVAALMTPGAAAAQEEPLIGEIKAVGFNFCPRGWAKADGQLLAIRENTALFSLLGTMYGGDGRTTFALPDLRGRTIIGAGTGPGLSDARIGQKQGGMSAIEGEDVPSLPSLAVTYCIALEGRFPRRP